MSLKHQTHSHHKEHSHRSKAGKRGTGPISLGNLLQGTGGGGAGEGVRTDRKEESISAPPTEEINEDTREEAVPPGGEDEKGGEEEDTGGPSSEGPSATADRDISKEVPNPPGPKEPLPNQTPNQGPPPLDEGDSGGVAAPSRQTGTATDFTRAFGQPNPTSEFQSRLQSLGRPGSSQELQSMASGPSDPPPPMSSARNLMSGTGSEARPSLASRVGSSASRLGTRMQGLARGRGPVNQSFRNFSDPDFGGPSLEPSSLGAGIGDLGGDTLAGAGVEEGIGEIAALAAF